MPSSACGRAFTRRISQSTCGLPQVAWRFVSRKLKGGGGSARWVFRRGAVLRRGRRVVLASATRFRRSMLSHPACFFPASLPCPHLSQPCWQVPSTGQISRRVCRQSQGAPPRLARNPPSRASVARAVGLACGACSACGACGPALPWHASAVAPPLCRCLPPGRPRRRSAARPPLGRRRAARARPWGRRAFGAVPYIWAPCGHIL